MEKEALCPLLKGNMHLYPGTLFSHTQIIVSMGEASFFVIFLLTNDYILIIN
jgi:hypothetical protein